MHRKQQRLHAVLVKRKGPIFSHDSAQPHVAQRMLQKLEEFYNEVFRSFVSSPTIKNPSPNILPLLQASRQLFAEETVSQTVGEK